MPIGSLRHAFSDTVADVDGFIVRTRLGGGVGGGGGAATTAVVSPASRRGFVDQLQQPAAGPIALPTPPYANKDLQPPLTTTPALRRGMTRCGSPGFIAADAGAGGGGANGMRAKGQRRRSKFADDRPSTELKPTAEEESTTLPASGDGGDCTAVVRPPMASTIVGVGAGASFSLVDGMECKQRDGGAEPVCTVDCCCCCAGSLLLMWLQVGDISRSDIFMMHDAARHCHGGICIITKTSEGNLR